MQRLIVLPYQLFILDFREFEKNIINAKSNVTLKCGKIQKWLKYHREM